MAKAKHKEVSSDDEVPSGGKVPSGGETADLHESVMGEGISAAEDVDEGLDEEMFEEEFEGELDMGEFEDVPGFNVGAAAGEGSESFGTFLDAEEDLIPESGLLEFDTPESVCGRDGRVRITATTRVPWRWICQLLITRADGRTSRCTGWFIGPRTVMTAGHCVYSHSAGGWARRIEVIPGMNAASRPYGSQVGTSFRSVTGWTQSQSPNYDYGAIILPNKTLGNRVGWFGFTALSTSSLKNLLVNNSGYAGDKPFGTQWFNAGRITKVTSRRLYYMLDTYGGQSGSPTWRYRNGQRHAVGIHAYGGCPNKSTRITSAVFNNMKNWKNI